MAAPLTFSAYTGWVDVASAQNIPPGTRLITASDLLRYENFLAAVRDRINAHELSVLDIAPKVATLITELDAAEAVNATQAGQIATLIADLDTAEATIAKLVRGVGIASGSISMTATNRFYIHTGAAATYTLPTFATSPALDFTVKNRGTANVVLRGVETNKMYNTAVSDTITILPGAFLAVVNDGTYWNRVG